MEHHPEQAQETNNEQNESPFKEQQNLPETNESHESLADIKVKTHEVAASLVSEYLSADRSRQVVEQLQDIDRIESETIESQAASGALPPEIIRLQHNLESRGIYAGFMTPDEARKVADFAANVTEDIVSLKLERIRDTIFDSINGIRNRRDYSLNPERRMRLETLADKYIRYERGEIDTSRCFDQSKYLPLEDYPEPRDDRSFEDVRRSLKQEYDLDVDIDTYNNFRQPGERLGRNYYAYYLNNMEDNELLEEGIVDEGDVFQYGPFTRNDLSDIEMFAWASWTDVTNQRQKQHLGSLLSEYVPPRENDINTDLTREFIAREVLKNRRPEARNMIALTSALGQKGLEQITAAGKLLPEDWADTVAEFKKTLHLCTYYSSKICGMSKQELLDDYKAARPITPDYFGEIRDRAEGWTDKQAERADSDHAPYLTKLDDHLFNAEALYIDLISAIEPKNSGDSGQKVLGSVGLNAAANV